MRMDAAEEVRAAVRSCLRTGQVEGGSNPVFAVTGGICLTGLDDWERIIREEVRAYEYRRGQASTWAAPATHTFATWTDLCSYDGYRRERALRSLGGAPNPFFMALVFRRLNDWVPEVRRAARESLKAIVDDTDPVDVASALFAILPFWGSWGRMDQNDRNVLYEIAFSAPVNSAIIDRLACGVTGPLSRIMSELCRTPLLDRSISRLAREAVQPAVRARAYRALMEGRVSWVVESRWEWVNSLCLDKRRVTITEERELTIEVPSTLITLRVAAQDPSPKVRRVAAEILIRDLDMIGEEAVHLARYFSRDRSRAVAERGAFALRCLSQRDGVG